MLVGLMWRSRERPVSRASGCASPRRSRSPPAWPRARRSAAARAGARSRRSAGRARPPRRERARHALVVEDAEVPDHRLEAAAVAGRGDHDVGLDARAVGQADAGLVERLDACDDLDPPVPDRLDHRLVDDRRRHAEAAQATERALLGHGQAVLGQVADLLGADEVDDPVRPLRSQAREPSAKAGPIGERTSMFGGVRTASLTLRAPPSARS